MEHFLINSSVCLFVLWLVYKLLLESTSWHVFKRIYLLGTIIISVVIPFLVVKTVVVTVQEIPVLKFQNSMSPQQATQVAAKTDFAIDWFYVALGMYLLGVCIMLFRFTKNLIAFKIQKNDVVSSYKSYLLILRGEVTVPHSFWNRIFVSKKQYKQDLIPTVVLEHEKTHLDQKHSLDVLFVELLLVLFWFNPVLYMLRYAIKLNHEFLADQAVLKTGIPTKDYQELILHHATSQYQHAMANTFNFPLIKKRFTIMKTQTSQRSLLFRSLVLIPVIALLILSCGAKEKKYKIQNEQTVFQEPQTELTTDKLNTSKGNTYKAGFYVEVPNEPDTQDFKMRRAMIMASLSQNKPLNYQINNKKTSVTELQKYLVNNHQADVVFIEGDENLLKFTDNNKSPMSQQELQTVYDLIFKYKPEENTPTFIAINETRWKVITVDATEPKGDFVRREKNYSYDATDLKNIKVYDENRNLLTNEEFKNLQMGFGYVWWQGEKKLKEMLNDPLVVESFKKEEAVLFYKGGYTKDYNEAINHDAKNTFLWIDQREDGIWIHLDPHSWADTNPSYYQFKKYLAK